MAGFYYTNDPVADAENYWGDRDEELSKLPKCDYCGEPIQDEKPYELLDGQKVCINCMEHCERWTDDYTE